MGTPVSGFLAEAMMRAFEDVALLKRQTTIWIQYADDNVVFIKRSDIEKAQAVVNNIFDGI